MHLSTPLLAPLLLLLFLPSLHAWHYRPSGLEECPSTHTSPRKPEHKTPHNGITGDTLQVLRCYCEAPTYDRWGYILAANYSNYHTGTSYNAQYLCSDDARSTLHMPKCWDARRRTGQTVCADDAQYNEFCYTLTYERVATPLLWMSQDDWMYAQDVYRFNQQTRSVHAQPPTFRPAPTECDDFCNFYLDGMQTARDGGHDGWRKTLDLDGGLRPQVCNHKEVYTDLDDMCWRCKKVVHE